VTSASNKARAKARWARMDPVWRRPSNIAIELGEMKRDRLPIFVISTIALHAGVFAMIDPSDAAPRQAPKRAPIVVERIEKKPALPPPIVEPVAPPPPKRVVVKKSAPLVPPPPVAAPPAPRKVVGLSMDATVAGGDGPAFRVGETLRGETTVAPAPKPIATKETHAATPAVAAAPSTLELPRRLARIDPLYPEEYRGQRIEGQVTIALTIDREGEIASVEVIAPSPHEAFNRSAIATARRERFTPAIKDGVPIDHTIRCTYHFRLST
jgi:periplasmic protein TonB